jgi:hypothetical protein
MTEAADLHQRIAQAIRDTPARYPDDIATAVHAAIQPELARAEAAITRVRNAVHVADDEDVTDWQRGFRACSVVALQALDAPAAGAAATQATDDPTPGDQP